MKESTVLGLSAGFLGVGVAISVARTSPPSTYELSIHTGTPSLFWIITVGIILFSIFGTFQTQDIKQRVAFTGLTSTVILTVLYLPVLRGYYFYGESDALSQLGIAKAVVNGDGFLMDLFYPGVHSSGIILASILGTSLEEALLLFPFLVMTISLPILAIATRSITRQGSVGVIAIYVGLIFTPLYPLSTQPDPKPTIIAIFFAAVPLSILFLIIRIKDIRFSVLLLVSFCALYFYHPQQMLNFLIFGIILIGIVEIRGNNRIFIQPIPVFLAACLLTASLLMSHGTFQSTFENTLASLIFGSEGGTVTGRTSSLAALDISLPILALKFLAKDLFLGIGILGAIVAWISRPNILRFSPVAYITAVLPLGALFLVFLVVGYGNQIFRYVAMATFLLVPLAAVGIRELEIWAHDQRWFATVGLVLLLCSGLLVAVPTFHAAPYSERPGYHVPEGQIQGFETMFDYADENTVFMYVHSNPRRYYDATKSAPINEEYPSYIVKDREPVPDHFEGIEEEQQQNFYLSITQTDRHTHAELWRGFRFNQNDFDKLDTNSDINRIYDNNHTVFYYGI